jgi:1-deoxy-D-xylulose-5-phosphate reductoisomerase
MRLPISLGLDWPHRVAGVGVPLDWTAAHTWTFEPLDGEAFPAVALARRVGEAGGTWPAVYNAANEVAVDAFHDGQIGFVGIVDTVAAVVDAYAAEPAFGVTDLSLDDVLGADAWARKAASALL